MHRNSVFSQTIFLALISCFLWSTAFAGIKIGLAYTTPLRFAGLRFMLSGLLILPFVRNFPAEFLKLRNNMGRVIKISLFQTALLYTFFYLGIDKTPAAVAAIIVGAGPLFIALMAHFTTGRDLMTTHKAVALLIGFTGIVLLALSREKDTNGYPQVLLGIILLVIGNLAGGYGNILVSIDRRGISPVLLNAVQIFLGGAMIFVFSLWMEGTSFSTKPLPYYLSLGWLAFLSAAAFTLWFVVLSRPGVKVSEINVWKFIIPMLGAIISWALIPGEHPQWNTVTGMLLIAVAIVIVYGRRWFAAALQERS